MSDKETIKTIAKERIEILFNLAKKESKKNPKRAKRYVYIAKKIGMKAKVSLNKYKFNYCKKCGSYLNSKRTRIKDSKIVQTCNICGYITRYPLKKQNKE